MGELHAQKKTECVGCFCVLLTCVMGGIIFLFLFRLKSDGSTRPLPRTDVLSSLRSKCPGLTRKADPISSVRAQLPRDC